MQCQRRQCFMDIQSETYRPNPTLYDKLICKNLKNIEKHESIDSVCGWEMGKCGVFILSHSHQAIPIPIKL